MAEVRTLYSFTQWLSLEQLRALLDTGEVVVEEPNGTTLRLYVNFDDRVAAKEVVQAKRK
jgi:hypothetical protein